jgi:TPR repeat protein
MRNVLAAAAALLLASCAVFQPPAVPSAPAETPSATDRARAASLLREGRRAQNPPRGTAPDPDRAATLIEQAARLGDADAQLLVALAHLAGPDRDPAAAVPWLLRSAQQGNAEAQFRLARQIEAGEGTPRETAWAAVWFQRAGARGVAEAQYALALLQLAGIGTAQDQGEALARLRIAEQRGVPGARRYREALEPRVPRAEANAAAGRVRAEMTHGPVVTPDRALVDFVQFVLRPGPVDGQDGPATRAALLDFARREGIATANPYDPAVIDRLRARAPR